MSEQNKTKLAVFEGKQIRKVLHDSAWWFAIVDVVAALTDSVNPADYFKKMRKRDPELNALLKGGDKLPPLRWRSRRQEAFKKSNVAHRRHPAPHPVDSECEG